MGMFSWECKGCGEELCTPEIGIAKEDEFTMVSGEYDGYGRFGGAELDSFELAVWHLECYKKATPEEQADLEPSESAKDQGFGWANPDFCSEDDAENIRYSKARQERKLKEYDSGLTIPCPNCEEYMIPDDGTVVCSHCEEMVNGEGETMLGMLKENIERFKRKISSARENDWGEVYIRDISMDIY